MVEATMRLSVIDPSLYACRGPISKTGYPLILAIAFELSPPLLDCDCDDCTTALRSLRVTCVV